MLEIFNSLKPFFEDNYRKISVREYAKLQKISPPTASKLLNNFKKEELLNCYKEKIYIYYYASRENDLFVNLSRVYWFQVFSKIGLLEHFEKELINPIIILFGSFAKAEISPKSDIDIAIFSISKKKLDIRRFQDILKREIQLFMFKSKDDVKNKDLLNSMMNGFVLKGSW